MAQNEERWRGYLKRCCAGDRQSLAQLYDETSSVTYGLALRMLNHPSAAAEVVLEVYQQVWTSPHTLEATGSVLASLTSMTRRQALARIGQGEKDPSKGLLESFPPRYPRQDLSWATNATWCYGHSRYLIRRSARPSNWLFLAA